MTNYQRLEFIGDAVLELYITSKLYEIFPSATEGRLTCLKTSFVNNTFLHLLGKSIDLESYIILADNQSYSDICKEKLVADVLEALIGMNFIIIVIERDVGAIYLEFGIKMVETFLTEVIFVDGESPLAQFWQFGSNTQIEWPKFDSKSFTLYGRLIEIEEKIGIQFHNKFFLVQVSHLMVIYR